MPPSLPYVIGIVVYDSSNVVSAGETVTAYNETNGELITADNVTNASGQTIIDLGNFPSGYTDGDFIQIAVSGTGTLGKDLRFKAVNYADFVQINQLDIAYEI